MSGNVVLCGSKNGCQTYMRLKEVGMCAQSMITILDLIMNIIWGGGRHVRSVQWAHNEDEDIYMSFEANEEVAMGLIWIC